LPDSLPRYLLMFFFSAHTRLPRLGFEMPGCSRGSPTACRDTTPATSACDSKRIGSFSFPNSPDLWSFAIDLWQSSVLRLHGFFPLVEQPPVESCNVQGVRFDNVLHAGLLSTFFSSVLFRLPLVLTGVWAFQNRRGRESVFPFWVVFFPNYRYFFRFDHGTVLEPLEFDRGWAHALVSREKGVVCHLVCCTESWR